MIENLTDEYYDLLEENKILRSMYNELKNNKEDNTDSLVRFTSFYEEKINSITSYYEGKLRGIKELVIVLQNICPEFIKDGNDSLKVIENILQIIENKEV